MNISRISEQFLLDENAMDMCVYFMISVVKTDFEVMDAFSIDIFTHKDSDMDIRNCFWALALTKKAQDYIIQLEKGWNIIHDSLQYVSSMNIASKFSLDDLLLVDDMVWFDENGNLIK